MMSDMHREELKRFGEFCSTHSYELPHPWQPVKQSQDCTFVVILLLFSEMHRHNPSVQTLRLTGGTAISERKRRRRTAGVIMMVLLSC